MKLRELNLITSDELCSDTYPDNLGKRSKLGGNPDWIQDEGKVKCPSCNSPMSFVAQIDSIDYTGDLSGKGEYMFGDVGMIYVFFCFECLESKSCFQGY